MQEHTLAQLLAEPDAGIDFSRVVHGDQRFSFEPADRRRRPAHRDAHRVEREDASAAHSMVTAESAIIDAAGAHVVTAISTLVVRGED